LEQEWSNFGRDRISGEPTGYLPTGRPAHSVSYDHQEATPPYTFEEAHDITNDDRIFIRLAHAPYVGRGAEIRRSFGESGGQYLGRWFRCRRPSRAPSKSQP